MEGVIIMTGALSRKTLAFNKKSKITHLQSEGAVSGLTSRVRSGSDAGMMVWIRRLQAWGVARLPRRLTVAVVLASAVFFGFGVWLHFRTRIFAFEPVIYGDAGDGLFNLWLLEHVTRTAAHGPSALADGRIFWPLNAYTYWWSDNLLVPGAVYAVLKSLLGDMFTAYRATVLLFSAVIFGVFTWLFAELWRGCRRVSACELPRWMLLLAPAAAYLAFFSQIRLHDYLHFQRLASLFLVTLVIGALRHAADLRRRDWLLMLVSELLLLYSAPYYAVLGLCVLLCRGFFLLADRRVHLWAWGWRNGLLALPVVLLCVPAALMYAKVDPVNYSLGEVRSLSLQAEHLYTPLGGWLRGVLASVLPDGLLAVRAGGYPGAGLLVGTVLATGLVLVAGRRRLRDWSRPLPVRVFLLLWAVTLIGDRAVMPFTWGLRLVLVPSGLILLAWTWRRAAHTPASRQLAMLVAALVAFYGTAFGPGTHFKPPFTDISVWSVFAWLVPGYLNMREVLRFSSLGQLLLLALLWWLLLNAWAATRERLVARVALGGLVVLLAGLQLSETIGTRVLETLIEPGQVTLAADEAAFFRGLQGSMLAIPAAPFHQNPCHQLRWVAFPDLYLLNGYSARSTDVFDRLLEMESQHGGASDEQLAYAAGVGAQFVCLLRGQVPVAVQQHLQTRYPTRFANDRFLVLALPAFAADR